MTGAGRERLEWPNPVGHPCLPEHGVKCPSVPLRVERRPLLRVAEDAIVVAVESSSAALLQ